MKYGTAAAALAEDGFCTLPGIYTAAEIEAIGHALAQADTSGATFRKSAELFAVRQFLKTIPAAAELAFNEKLLEVVRTLFGKDAFAVKSIYFDKPGTSNWFVAWHQDLTISTDKKLPLDGYGPWTVKQGQFAVQPPIEILENSYTVRIHLDDTDELNGALNVVPGSHRKGIYRPETIDWQRETAVSCPVPAGGVMLMRPLLLHSSGRTVSDRRRRVIHIEFCDSALPEGLEWAEKRMLPL